MRHVDIPDHNHDDGNPLLRTMLGAALLAVTIVGFFAWNDFKSGSVATAVLVAQTR
jgi:hypothetical protein